jgi:hypothetical protein
LYNLTCSTISGLGNKWKYLNPTKQRHSREADSCRVLLEEASYCITYTVLLQTFDSLP